MKNGVIAILGLAAIVLAAFAPTASHAAGPQLLITWKAAGSSAPANYDGKVLPGKNASVTASVAVIQANGQPANLSGRTIYWYLDNNFLASGVGKQTITFNAMGYAEIMALRVDITDYPGGALINTVHIPVTNPKVVIVAPYADGGFSGFSATVHAVPYYFPTADLKNLALSWAVSGVPAAGGDDPADLTVNLDPGAAVGSSIILSLSAQLSDAPLIMAQTVMTLTKNQ